MVMTLQEQKEIIEAALDGKKIQRHSLDASDYAEAWFTESDKNILFNFADYLYRVKPAEKKKVKMWQWAVIVVGSNGDISATKYFYIDKKSALLGTGAIEVVCKIEGSMIEVDE